MVKLPEVKETPISSRNPTIVDSDSEDSDGNKKKKKKGSDDDSNSESEKDDEGSKSGESEEMISARKKDESSAAESENDEASDSSAKNDGGSYTSGRTPGIGGKAVQKLVADFQDLQTAIGYDPITKKISPPGSGKDDPLDVQSELKHLGEDMK